MAAAPALKKRGDGGASAAPCGQHGSEDTASLLVCSAGGRPVLPALVVVLLAVAPV